jgi:hypothetical protein
MEAVAEAMRICASAQRVFRCFGGAVRVRNEKTPQQPTVRRRIAEAFPLRKASRNGEYTTAHSQGMIKNAGQE